MIDDTDVLLAVVVVVDVHADAVAAAAAVAVFVAAVVEVQVAGAAATAPGVANDLDEQTDLEMWTPSVYWEIRLENQIRPWSLRYSGYWKTDCLSLTIGGASVWPWVDPVGSTQGCVLPPPLLGHQMEALIGMIL